MRIHPGLVYPITKNQVITPHIYTIGGKWLVGFSHMTPLALVNDAMRWVVKTQGKTACPVRW